MRHFTAGNWSTAPVAVNWSDRPDYADPPEIGPDDGTGLGDRGEEGDDPDA